MQLLTHLLQHETKQAYLAFKTNADQDLLYTHQQK